MHWSGHDSGGRTESRLATVLQSAVDCEDFEQEIVDQYAPALAATGAGESMLEFNCRAVVDFVRFSDSGPPA
ncbi:hypothetical protein [Streptomyces sp. WAC00263]|uniref:hypothetical protein n=1 Tax=Streptomyces sp. WAC00263 TaxID=1917422 RepID=UPI0015EFB231|nr:hypothetical protein [Streptomyces sp. WAC00263]KAF5994148.1 hypothetical protein BOG92_022615 [Streptomyces sp. WAC00263]